MRPQHYILTAIAFALAVGLVGPVQARDDGKTATTRPPTTTTAKESRRPATRYGTTAPSLPPLKKNIFFPSRYLSERVPAPPRIGKPSSEPEFVLVGTVMGARRRAALIEYSGTGATRWVEQGEEIGTMTLAEITVGGVVLERDAQRVDLAVGHSSSALLRGRKISGDDFEVVGICRAGETRFALVKLSGLGNIHRMRVDDRFGTGSVTEITADGIVMTSADVERVIPIGGRFVPSGEIK